MTVPGLVYIVCALTSVASACLLARGTRGPGGRLMFWAALFFVGMAINNVLLFVDTAVVPEVDWSLAPNLVALTSLVFLLYGLIWETT